MENLRIISETPWAMETKMDTLIASKLTHKFANTMKNIHTNKRPSTQACQRNPRYSFFQQNREPVYRNLVSTPSSEIMDSDSFIMKEKMKNQLL